MTARPMDIPQLRPTILLSPRVREPYLGRTYTPPAAMTTLLRMPPLRRSDSNEMVAGVLGGVAEYFGLNPGRTRIAFVLASIFSAGFPGIITYFLLWYLIPSREPESSGYQPRGY